MFLITFLSSRYFPNGRIWLAALYYALIASFYIAMARTDGAIESLVVLGFPALSIFFYFIFPKLDKYVEAKLLRLARDKQPTEQLLMLRSWHRTVPSQLMVTDTIMLLISIGMLILKVKQLIVFISSGS